ncbi:MAG TPA: CDP-alcohol phosphatidyltransferase family protein [Chthoniobacterales bacterium]|jgi:phosphatidylglycerophosphate synthase|nr:CDP-alcohol phosphatidyltransferase family protein [Chthoniobacterales bacterium]
MDSPRPQLLILADAPSALVELFGISMVERLLRITQRLGFREALILSKTPDAVAAHLAKPSWARNEVAVKFCHRETDPVLISDIAPGAERILLVSASFYYDARLLRALSESAATTLLVDSEPPGESLPLWRNEDTEFRGAALLEREWLDRRRYEVSLFEQLSGEAAAGRIHVCDAAAEPTYVMSLRKHVRPVFFPAPTPELINVAEKFPRDIAQNGVLDFPGFLDSPIEDWIVKKICRTSIRPNQITFVTMLIGLTVTVLFASGRLWWGVALAYTIEVLDGIDGKLARTKVETTAAGEWEHDIDYTIELSWWTALAFHFYTAGLAGAWWLLALYVGFDLIDRLAKRAAKRRVGRNLDDVSNFDRFVRCIGARRNINIWILIAALVLGDARSGFVLFCCWGAATALAHLVRVVQIRAAPKPS